MPSTLENEGDGESTENKGWGQAGRRNIIYSQVHHLEGSGSWREEKRLSEMISNC